MNFTMKEIGFYGGARPETCKRLFDDLLQERIFAVDTFLLLTRAKKRRKTFWWIAKKQATSLL